MPTATQSHPANIFLNDLVKGLEMSLERCKNPVGRIPTRHPNFVATRISDPFTGDLASSFRQRIAYQIDPLNRYFDRNENPEAQKAYRGLENMRERFEEIARLLKSRADAPLSLSGVSKDYGHLVNEATLYARVLRDYFQEHFSAEQSN